MKLGILVNTDKHFSHLLGLAASATAKGHEVLIFATDEGIRLLDDDSLAELADLKSVSITVCDHSCKEHGVSTEGRSEAITIGSQYHNATMAHDADRVIVL